MLELRRHEMVRSAGTLGELAIVPFRIRYRPSLVTPVAPDGMIFWAADMNSAANRWLVLDISFAIASTEAATLLSSGSSPPRAIFWIRVAEVTFPTPL